MAARRLPVRRPYERIVAHVANQSERTATVQAIAIHTTESHPRPGLADLRAVVGWFDNPRSQASSHVIVDAEGMSAQCVPDERKAWTIGAFNSLTLNIELIGWANTPRWRWLRRERQLKKTAKYLAYWSKRYGIPLDRGRLARSPNGQAIVARKGVVCHVDATNCGFGTHTDPGEGFPMDRLLRAARYYARMGWPK